MFKEIQNLEPFYASTTTTTVVHNDVTVVWGGGQLFCDVNKSLVPKKRQDVGRGFKITQNCVTSFMDDPHTKSVTLIKR